MKERITLETRILPDVRAYKDLLSREETRNAVWQQEGWHEVVYYTVPLIQRMDSRIMIPTKASPLK